MLELDASVAAIGPSTPDSSVTSPARGLGDFAASIASTTDSVQGRIRDNGKRDLLTQLARGPTLLRQ